MSELYHPGYVAKRMEIGAVVGATPAANVRRECPAPGDIVVLLGGRTGRDGIGGATGSSKAHNVESLEKRRRRGAEGQRPRGAQAPAPVPQREDARRLIKRCNDFGAGGVSVAVGELADGLLCRPRTLCPRSTRAWTAPSSPSPSRQERMAVALAPEDVEEFMSYAREENLEATVIATVTEEPRLKMVWDGATIVDVSREFLASNGAPKSTSVHVGKPEAYSHTWAGSTLAEKLRSLVTDSQRGLQ